MEQPTLIALRAGDPIVAALKRAGPGPLVILRVLPLVTETVRRGPLSGPPLEPWERMESTERAVRSQLAALVGRRRPAPRLVVGFGDYREQAAELVAEVRAARVIAPAAMAEALAAVVEVPVLNAEDGSEARAPRPWRRLFEAHASEKLAALRAMPVFAGVGARDLRQLATLLDTVEVGPGEVLTREGRPNESLWILLEGSAARSVGGRQMECLGPLSLVGAPSLLFGEPALATVTTAEPVRALVAGRRQFQEIEAIDPVLLRLKAATADRLRDYTRLSLTVA